MTKLRTALTIGVVVVAAIGAAAGVAVVYETSPAAARPLLAVDTGMLVALAVTVWVLLGPLSKRMDDIVEALRALARGEKHTRVEPADFAGLAEIARATNEVGAYLCENDDPNLGPVLKRSRDHAVEVPQPRRSAGETRPPPLLAEATAARPSRAGVQEISEHPELGAVRVRPREAARAGGEAPAPIIDGESVSEPRPARRRSTKPAASDASASSPDALVERPVQKPPERSASKPSDDSVPASAVPDAASQTATVSSPASASPNAAGAAGATEGATVIPVSLTSEPPAASPEPPPAVSASVADMSTLPPASPDESSVAAPTASASTETLAEGAVDASAVQMPGAPHAGTDSGAAASSDVSAPSANDTLIEPAPPVAAGVPASSAASSAESSAASSAETSAAAASSQLPTSDELRALFNEFLRAKKAAGVDDGLDVDFDAFADTIRGESERLIHDHGCRGVRFEVALAEGEVSLRPRLVR